MMNSAICLLERAFALAPEAVAIEDGETVLSYGAVRAQARRIGAGLLHAGISDQPVMVILPKSAQMILGFYGAQYAGRAYVPTDAAAPTARLQKIIRNLHPSAIVTNEAIREKLAVLELADTPIFLIEALLQTPPDDPAVDQAYQACTDADPIYVMYTSGSTGEPKGVTIAHRGVINFALWAKKTFRWSRETVIANQAPLYFDVSVMDVYGALACAGRLILTPEILFQFPLKLPEFLRDHRVTHIYWVPTVMIHIANSGALSDVALPALKTVAFAGEVMPNLQLNIWRKALPGRLFANLYGPTETDVCTCYIADRAFTDSEPLPIGKPIDNMRVLILDAQGQPVPPGETGEICVAGSGVNIGYWNNPSVTAAAFVPDPDRPFLRTQLYRTGDLGYRNGYGEIMFIGRKDGQIKVRGNRIELGEIESAARLVDGVSNVCALFDRTRQEIVLFVESEREQSQRKFNRELRKYIPAYMIPQKLVVMQSLPLNANRKINRTALAQYMEEQTNG